MKKLIAIAVVLVLAAGAVFAADVSGTVIGKITVISGDNDDTNGEEIEGSGGGRYLVEASGEVAEGKFGAWIRVGNEQVHWNGGGSDNVGLAALAWWKPIDQLKVSIGGNPDGIWGKEGVTAWMFYQHTSDTGVVKPGNAWGGSYGNEINFREAFYGGFDGAGLLLEAKPIDMITVNLAIPFLALQEAGGDHALIPDGTAGVVRVGQIFKGMHAQVAVNLDNIGSFALSYSGKNAHDSGEKGAIFASFSLTAVENLGVDFGIGYKLTRADGTDADKKPLNIGLGAKYSMGAFSVKLRTMFSLDTWADRGKFDMLFDVLPYYAINDDTRAYVSVGFATGKATKNADSYFNFHINPYVEIGGEWGPKFIAGFQLVSDKDTAGDTVMSWALPIALFVSF